MQAVLLPCPAAAHSRGPTGEVCAVGEDQLGSQDLFAAQASIG